MRHLVRGWKALGAACLIGLALAPPARAGLIGFDDFSGGAGILPNPYQGFVWNAIGYFPAGSYPGNGYYRALHSGSNVGYSTVDTVSSFSSLGNTQFTFTSGYFASAFNDGLTVQVNGLRNGNQLYTQTLVLNTTSQTFATFNYVGIDEVEFRVISSGTLGHNLPYFGNGDQFGMDDLDVSFATTTPVPVPPTGILAAIGAAATAAFGAARRRRLIVLA